MMTSPYLQDVFDYAQSFLGTPYIYGGNSHMIGMDCSGFICEVLRSVGLVGDHEDLSAQELYEKLSKAGTPAVGRPYAGCLMFYGLSIRHISHVGLCINPFSLIECGGGNETTISLEHAAMRGACVRMRGSFHRQDYISIIYPRYPWESP